MKRFLSKDKSLNPALVFTLLFFIVLVVYSNSFHAEWHFDDRHSIVNNTKIHITEFSLPVLAQVIKHPDADRVWRPLAYLSFGLNWYIGQDRVYGYHIVNILLHIITAFILFLTLRCLFLTPVLREKTSFRRAYSISLLTAVFWAINPIQTQAVTYIVQRMTLLSALFYISGILFYLHSRLAERKLYRYSFLTFCSLSWMLAMASKENAIILPLTLLLVEMVFFQDLSNIQIRRRYLGLFAAVAVVVGIIGIIVFLQSSPLTLMKGYNDRYFTPWERLITQPRVIIFYLSQIFFPHPARLSIEHDIALSTSLIHPWSTLPAIISVFGIIITAMVKIVRYPLICFSVLFFFLNHTIESSILPLEMIFEHRNYLPSMFIFVPVTAALAWLIGKYCHHTNRKCLSVLCVVIAILIAFGVGTYRRNIMWSDEVTLWSDAFRKAPGLHRTVHNFAMAYYENAGRLEEALRLYYQADGLKMHRRSHRADLYGNIANIYSRLGQFQRAEAYYEKAISIAPHKNDLYLRLSNLFRRIGHWDSALEHVNELIRRRPQNSEYLNLKGIILLNQKKYSQALQMFRLAIKSAPEHSVGYLNAGVALMAIGADERAEKLIKAGLPLASVDLLPYLRLIDVNLRLDDQDEVNSLVIFLIQSASAEDIYLSLKDIANEPFNDTEKFRRLEETISAEMKKRLPAYENEFGHDD